MQTATWAIEYPLVERHLLSMSALTACLTGVCRVNFVELAASLFRFASQLTKELRPCCITDTLCQTMVMGHPVNVEVFHTDDPMLSHGMMAILMREVGTSKLHPFIDTRDRLAVLLAFFGALRKLGVFALDFHQRFLFLAKKTGVLNLLPIREGGKGLESHVNAHLRRALRKSFWLTLNRKGGIPFVGGGTVDGTGFDLALDLAMIGHLDAPDFGEAHPIIMCDGETRLREGEGVIPSIAFKTWVARFLSRFASSEECFKRQVNTHCDILENLGVDAVESGTLFLQYRITGLLPITGQTPSLLFPRILALFEQMVIKPTAFIKGGLKRFQLFLRREYPILKVLIHIS